jgi:hypothetical protein
MAEEITTPAVDDNDPVPYFKIGAQTFQTGMGAHGPDSIIPWAVPEGWDEKKWGKHYASYGPSVTWTPLNKAAKVLMDKRKANVAAELAPKLSPTEVLMAQQAETLKLLAEAVTKLARK